MTASAADRTGAGGGAGRIGGWLGRPATPDPAAPDAPGPSGPALAGAIRCGYARRAVALADRTAVGPAVTNRGIDTANGPYLR